MGIKTRGVCCMLKTALDPRCAIGQKETSLGSIASKPVCDSRSTIIFGRTSVYTNPAQEVASNEGLGLNKYIHVSPLALEKDAMTTNLPTPGNASASRNTHAQYNVSPSTVTCRGRTCWMGGSVVNDAPAGGNLPRPYASERGRCIDYV